MVSSPCREATLGVRTRGNGSAGTWVAGEPRGENFGGAPHTTARGLFPLKRACLTLAGRAGGRLCARKKHSGALSQARKLGVAFYLELPAGVPTSPRQTGSA